MVLVISIFEPVPMTASMPVSRPRRKKGVVKSCPKDGAELHKRSDGGRKATLRREPNTNARWIGPKSRVKDFRLL